MAVFHPNLSFLQAQLQSLAQQDYDRLQLTIVIADTRAGPLVRPMVDRLGLAAQYVQPPAPLSAVQAFEAGLKRALDTAQNPQTCFAFCDQDDIWRPDRLAKGQAALRRHAVDLVHSDCCLVDQAGDLIHPSCRAVENRLQTPSLRDLLYRNAMTGMTMLFTRDLAQRALPFPRQSGTHFYHDLWLALLAQSGRGAHFINQPLVQYRQHDQNLVGAQPVKDGAHKDPLVNPPLNRPFDLPIKRGSRKWIQQKAASFALARYLAHAVAERLPDDHPTPRSLRPYLGPRRARMLFWSDALRLALRGRFSLARTALSHGVVCAARSLWIMRHCLRLGLPQARAQIDQKLYRLSPGLSPASMSQPLPAKPHSRFEDPRMQAHWTPDFNALRPSINLLLPSLNPPEMFAGLTTALDLGAGLAERGHPVRFIATDQPVAAPAVSLEFIRARTGPMGRKNLSLACGVQSSQLSAHRQDRFIATAWWTAHIAAQMIAQHSFAQPRFHYLIQDHEPHFYPWGPSFAEAQASYDLPCVPIFNTSLLRQYFAQQGHAFAAGADDTPLSFHPSIALGQYLGPRPPADHPTQLLLYGRPEVARNMFPTAIQALAQFLHIHAPDPKDIRLLSAGQPHADVTFPNGYQLHSLGKLPLQDYPDLLRRSHIGLSLMYSPHPSHVPLEMAASGMRVVTNGFSPKSLDHLSPAIHSCRPTSVALATALGAAWQNRQVPVPDKDRALDLTQLGDPFDQMLDQLSASLKTGAAIAAE